MTDTSTAPTGARIEGQPELVRAIGPKLLLLFIVGDILGAGIYAITGDVAKEVGGVVWLPFLIAFIVAVITAFSYLELVTKYPQAAGAALYAHKAFGVHFITFLICFTVMCSGVTSASTASRAFASNFNALIASVGGGEASAASPVLTTTIAVFFIVLVMLLNLRGVSESVKTNIVLTCVELSGLLIVILVGFFAFSQGRADFSRTVIFDTPEDKSIFVAVTAGTTLAFFAMVGFEDSVNMAEETKDPVKIFPKIMLTGLGITGAIYLLVSICAIALVPAGELGAGGQPPLLQVVTTGAPNAPLDQIYPLISMFAVANTALINMLMASRLLYGMANQGVLPPVFGRVLAERRTPWVSILFTSALAVGLIVLVSVVLAGSSGPSPISQLGNTTAFLLLMVFTVVNICCLVLRKDPVRHRHFVAPTVLPVLGAAFCAFLLGPWTGRPTTVYWIAGILLGIGVLLWLVTFLVNRALYSRKTYIKNPDELEDMHDR